jgi:hypothetical protein
MGAAISLTTNTSFYSLISPTAYGANGVVQKNPDNESEPNSSERIE